MRNALLICMCVLAGVASVPSAQAQGTSSPIVDEAVIAPFLALPFMETDAGTDHFANAPSYWLRSNRQVLINGDRNDAWEDDYAANVKVAWNSEAIFFRLDVRDDSRVSAVAREGISESGDSFTLSFQHRTVGAHSRATEPWRVHLYPQFEQNAVRVHVEPGDQATGARLGNIQARMFTEQRSYTVLLRIPFAGWQDPPKPATQMRFQILFADDDNPDVEGIDHLFSLFPAPQGRRDAATNVTSFGTLHFSGNVWLDIRPDDVLFDDGKFRFRLRYGNMTETAMPIHIEVQPNQPGAPLVKTFETIEVMQPMRRMDEISKELPMADIPAGAVVRLRAVSGLYEAPSKPVIHTLSNIVYLPQSIERQGKYPIRDLAIHATRTGALDTFRHMAGGGQVIWNIGRYDASSEDIPERLRSKGPHTIEIPTATANDLPWALFGGMDHLDKMAEPLVMNMLPQVFTGLPKLSPQLPEFPYLDNDRRFQRKAVRSSRLLLIGLVYDYAGPDAMPEIVVQAGRRVLIREKLVGTPHGGHGKRHVYVLRVWLEEASEFSTISISNVAPFGPRAEIDFIALLGGNEPVGYDAGSPSLSFGGSPAATVFTQQLATSLFFMKNYLVGRSGEGYQSLPGGRDELAETADLGLFMEELAAWGALTEAERIALRMHVEMRRMRDEYQRTGDMTVGYPAMLIGLHELWRKQPSFNVQRGWLTMVHYPITDMVNEMGRHPMGLINAVGPYGVQHPTRRGTTQAMVIATDAALRSAAALTSSPQLGYRQSGTRWLQEAQQMPDRMRRWLVAPAGNLRLQSNEPHPASFGLPAQEFGVSEELPADAWLFGRYTDQQPILYNNDRRVYDTPYIFSALPFHISRTGFMLEDRVRTELNTSLNYLYFMSPLFRGTTRPIFLNHGILEYDTSDIQLYTIMASALADNMPITTRLLDAYIGYTFDEYAPLPDAPGRRADAYISPYTFQQRLNVSNEGENLGASMDDLNMRTGTLALRIARLISGIDDSNTQRLRLLPRLPDTWSSIDARNWLVTHSFRNASVAPVSYSYERINDVYTLSFSSREMVEQLQIRFGPYPRHVRRVVITGDGTSSRVTTVEEGAHTWAYRTVRNVTDLKLQCRPVN